jgi:hypothetical protein
MANNNTIIHKTAKGKVVDMDKLLNQNELTIAVGNTNTNARGDELGPGGQIIRKREEISREGHVRAESNTTFKTVKPAAPVAPAIQPPITQVKETKKPAATEGDA